MEISTFDYLLAILSSSSISVIISLIVGWLKDAWVEGKSEEKRIQKIKEDSYKEVMRNVDFVYNRPNLDRNIIEKKRNDFLLNYRLMFLYSSDEVVKEINNLIDIMTIWPTVAAVTSEMQEKRKKLGQAMIVLRRQVLPKTKLTADDFLHVT